MEGDSNGNSAIKDAPTRGTTTNSVTGSATGSTIDSSVDKGSGSESDEWSSTDQNTIRGNGGYSTGGFSSTGFGASGDSSSSSGRVRVTAVPISGGFESTSNATQTSYFNEAEAEVGRDDGILSLVY